ncbi:MAG TPA: hypothetical protein VFH85_07915 [Gammaproteobacteria bacterium]|nr:hypothetical protein [Gammaproteobacteria bacterium]
METNHANIMIEEDGFALAHCPFCGSSEAVGFVSAAELYPDGNGYAVCCDASTVNAMGGCGGVGGFDLTKSGAATRWNRRSNT